MSHDRCMRLLMMRLRVPEGHIFPLPHVSLYVNSKKAYVFGVNKNEEPFTLEDDPELFPSDLLITQLRLIIG